MIDVVRGYPVDESLGEPPSEEILEALALREVKQLVKTVCSQKCCGAGLLDHLVELLQCVW